MVLENELLPYFEWLLGSDSSTGVLWQFLLTTGMLALVVFIGSLLVGILRAEPLKAGDRIYRTISLGIKELFLLSPRRIYALARLAIQEALRKRVLVSIVVFVVILLFANWFLKTDQPDPAKLYLSFVLTSTTYLILIVSLLISTVSLPNDIKNKTIYTIVTKPVRSVDIVLGRVLGFSLLGTFLLLVMGLIGYMFVIRTLDHTHTVEVASLQPVYATEASAENRGEPIYYKGRTTNEAFHRHEVEIWSDGNGLAETALGHEHEISKSGDKYILSKPHGFMQARVPLRGKLRFLGRKGEPTERGVNVGDVWMYRSFIAGGSLASAIWTFEDISEDALDAQGALPLELITRVFRTYQGNIDQGIEGTIQLRNPDTGLTNSIETFTALDAKIDRISLPRAQIDPKTDREIDLIKDLVSKNGKIEVIIQCLANNQYFGFAQADCYIRLPDASPTLNFCKAFIGIWSQMVIVICIGVACSTFVSGPIAILFTMSYLLLGFFKSYFVEISSVNPLGGGPIESLARMIGQKNMTVKFVESTKVDIMKWLDESFLVLMRSVAAILPDFDALSQVDFVAYGFDVPVNMVFQNLTVCAAYLFAATIIGYFCLRTREVAK